MKTIHEILKLVHKEYEANKDNITGCNHYAGLCGVGYTINMRGIISYAEVGEFDKYLFENRPQRLRNLSDVDLVDQYYWELHICRYRIQWLNKHIKLTK